MTNPKPEPPVAAEQISGSPDQSVKPPVTTTGSQTPARIAVALDAFLHKAEDIKSASRFVAIADQARKERFQNATKELSEVATLLAAKDGKAILGIKKCWEMFQRLDHLVKSRESQVIETSLFLGLFSAFDAFTGDLIATIYRKRPQLFTSLQRTVAVSEILKHKSFSELQAAILRDEIESLRRKSYVDQFKELETTFGIKLRAFTRWPQFVELSQRRNLLTHCDGEVSEQYLEICNREGCEHKDPVKVGDKLSLGSAYFMSACELATEVAVKLAHTLWRKLFPEELEEADKELSVTIYNCLVAENYEAAQVFGLFAKEQKTVSSDVNRRIFLINYAIALKADKKPDEAARELAGADWTACSLDFKLAEAVLAERNSEACGLMKKMGKNGEIIREESYHVWPLFRWFRATQEFLDTYHQIYGRPFVIELQKTALNKAQLSLETSGPPDLVVPDNTSEEQPVVQQP